MKKLLTLALSFAAMAAAQGTRLDGPTPGFVFDSESRELRPIRGVVGAAAHVAAALVAGADAASVSPDGLLAVASRGGSLELIRGVDSDSPASVTLGEVPAGALLISWAEDAVAAVSPAGRKAFVWRDVRATPDLEAVYDLGPIEGAISSAVFDGTRVVLAAKGGVYLAEADSTRLLKDLDSPAGLAIDGRDLYVADRGRGEIWQIHDYASSASALLFAADVESPVGVQVSRKRLLVASAAEKAVIAFDLESRQAVGRVELEFAPARLEPLGAKPLALLNQLSSGEPLWVLDSGERIAAYFVPAGREQ